MRVYQKAIEMNHKLARVAPILERHDRDLVRQLKRAASSVALNLAEGLGTRGGNRELRFQTALGSAREVAACLEVADAWGYLGAAGRESADCVDVLIRMLVCLVRARS